MRKIVEETLQWHPVEIRYPEHLKLVILKANYGILRGFWNKTEQFWVAEGGTSGFLKLNSDTHVYYWANYPEGPK